MSYIYLGDRLTAEELKGQRCQAVRRPDGRCIRSRVGTMLVQFDSGAVVVVLARRLRKLASDTANEPAKQADDAPPEQTQ